MRKNFGAKAILYPMPVLIIGTYNEDGKPNAMNAAWGGISEETQISICVDDGHKTAKNVSVADVENIVACDYVGIVSGNNEPDKIEKAGWHVTKSEFVNAPVINELPLTLECQVLSYDDETEIKPTTVNKICICAIAKCENKYINDWVNYHLNSGIDEIHIYDNNDKSYSPVENCIKINSGRVVIHKIPDAKNFQRGVYTKFYIQNKDRFDWIIFIDIDEFINLNNQYTSIKEFLNDKLFYDTDVIRLKWKIFGDGDLITRDINIPVYKGITKPSNNTIFNSQAKCIVRGGLDNVIFESVHYPLINGVVPKQKLPNGKITYGKISINEKSNGICLNHYMTKTIAEFIDQKLARGTDACFPERVIDFDYFWKINDKTANKLNYIKFKGFKI